MKMRVLRSATAISMLLAGSQALAAGFQLTENSSEGLGRAYAGEVAVGNSAAVVHSNPALMTQFTRPTISAGAVIVDSSASVNGTFNGQRVFEKSAIPTKAIPNAAGILPLGDKAAVGVGVNATYGMATEYGKDFAAGPFAGTTDLEAVNLTLAGAYKVTDKLSLGVGFNAVHAKAEVERTFGNTASTLSAFGVKNSSILHHLEGSKWGYGWNAGVKYDITPKHRVALAYHSAVGIDFDGHYKNDLPSVSSLPAAYQTLYGYVLSRSGVTPTASQTVPGSLKLTLPAYWELGSSHQLTDKLSMQLGFKRTEWSKFKSLNAYGSNGTELFSKEENFSDANRYSIGFTYDANDKLTLRTGFAYDEAASKTSPSISIPDTDRNWYSLGATYRFTPNLSADLGFTHIRGHKSSFNEAQGTASGRFSLKTYANLYGLNVNYSF